MIKHFILHSFYLNSQIAFTVAFTGYIFVTYYHCRKYSFFWYPLSSGKLVVNPVRFLLRENNKRGNHGIIVLFYYLVKI